MATDGQVSFSAALTDCAVSFNPGKGVAFVVGRQKTLCRPVDPVSNFRAEILNRFCQAVSQPD
jgi:hypothetical protein